jgi:4-amino-4-deoxy-L-arabinose transferase-like glycosyltransferase
MLVAGLGGSEHAGFFVSVLLGAAATVPLWLVVRDAVGEREAGVAALLYAVLPAMVEVTADVMTEGPYFFFLILAVWLGHRALDGDLRWALGAGAAGAGAYLTRNEGVVVVAGVCCWLVVEGIRRRELRPWMSAGAVVWAWAVVSLPYLLWVHDEVGRWALTAKGSGRAVEAMARAQAPSAAEGSLYVRYAKYLWRAASGVLLPFAAVGLASCWKRRGALYLASFGVVYFGGILYALPHLGYLSYRYFLPGFCLLLAATASGWLLATERLKPVIARWALAALVVSLLVVAAIPHRWNERALVDAARWIGEQEPGARIVTTAEKVGWYAKGTAVGFPDTVERLLAVDADFLVTTSRDREPAYLATLDTLSGFEKVPEDFVRGRAKQDAVAVYRRRR